MTETFDFADPWGRMARKNQPGAIRIACDHDSQCGSDRNQWTEVDYLAPGEPIPEGWRLATRLDRDVPSSPAGEWTGEVGERRYTDTLARLIAPRARPAVKPPETGAIE